MEFFEHAAVGGGFLGEGFGVGAGGGGHAVEAHGAVEEGEGGGVPDSGSVGGDEGEEGVGGFLSGGDDGGAEGEPAEGGFEVDGGDDFQEFVGGVAAQAADFKGGVGESDALCGEEGAEAFFVESVAGVGEEVVFVPEEDEPEDTPHVVLEIGVVEVHFPACARGREAAEHEDAGVSGEERRERMLFGHGLSGLEEEVQEGEFVGFKSEAEDGAAADGGEE